MTQALQQVVTELTKRLPEEQQEQLALLLSQVIRIDPDYGLIFSPTPNRIEELGLTEEGLQTVREELGLT